MNQLEVLATQWLRIEGQRCDCCTLVPLARDYWTVSQKIWLDEPSAARFIGKLWSRKG